VENSQINTSNNTNPVFENKIDLKTCEMLLELMLERLKKNNKALKIKAEYKTETRLAKSIKKKKDNSNMKNKNLLTLEEFKEKNYGKSGTKARKELEARYENFKIGELILNTRLEMGMTQEQLAEK